MAMAPPLGLTWSMSGWSSCSQASTTEAKASLISITSMSSRRSLAFSSTSRVAGMGAVSMMTGSLAATAKVWNRARGRRPERPARSSDMIEHGRRPVGDLRRRRRRDQAVLDEGRGQGGQLLDARCLAADAPRRPVEDVPSSRRVPMGPRVRGTISWAKRPSSWAWAARRCDCEGEGVHLVAADVPPPGDLLGREALVDELEAGVHGGPVGLAGPGVGGRPDGHPAHRLDARPDDDVHGAGHDGLGGEVDGLLGRPALAVDGGPGHVSGKPAASAALRPMFMACSPTVMVQPMTTSSTRAGSRSLRSTRARSGCGGQIDGVPARQPAVAPPHRGADGVDDHGVGHASPPVAEPHRGCRESGGVSDCSHIWRRVGSRSMDLHIDGHQERFRRRGAILARGPRPVGRPRHGTAPLARHRRGLRGPPGLGADHVRRPVVGGVVARGVRRPGRRAPRVADLRGGVLPGRRPHPGERRTGSSSWPPPCSSSGRPSRRRASCPPWRRARRSGARDGPSPTPGATWPPSAAGPTRSAGADRRARELGAQRAEDMVLAAAPSPTGASGCSGPIPRPSATGASPTSSCPWTAPGVTVRPIAQLDGETGFAEVFFEDVEVPADQVLGGVGEGWKVAMATAGSERGLSLRSPARYTEAGAPAGRALPPTAPTPTRRAPAALRRRRGPGRDRRRGLPAPHLLDRHPGARRRGRRSRGIDEQDLLVRDRPRHPRAPRWPARRGGRAARRRRPTAAVARRLPLRPGRARSTPAPTRSSATWWPSACSGCPGPEPHRAVGARCTSPSTSSQLEFRAQLRAFADKECTPADIREAWASALGWSPARWAALAEMGVVGLTVPEELRRAGSRPGRPGAAARGGRAGRAARAAGRDHRARGAGAGRARPAPQGEALRARWLAAGGRRRGRRSPWGRRRCRPCPGPRGPTSSCSSATGSCTRCRPPPSALTRPARARRRPADWPQVAWEPSPGDARRVGCRGRGGPRRAAPTGRRWAPGRCWWAWPTGSITMAAALRQGAVQFGKPIGSFQAVKHLLADALVRLEFARPVVYRAAWSFDQGDPDAGRARLDGQGHAPRRRHRWRPASPSRSTGPSATPGSATCTSG